MTVARSTLEILIDIKNGELAARQLGDVGAATQEAGEKAETGGRSFRSMAKSVLGVVGGALAIKKGFGFMRGAANDAIALAKGTAGLQRQTGMDAKAASGWVSMMKARGVETKAVQTALTAFSKQMSGLQLGAKGPTKALEALGVPIDRLKSLKGDVGAQIEAVADAFSKMPAGVDKAALATKLFGKGGLSLLPILDKGSAGIREQMKAMRDAGLVMDQSGVDKALEVAGAQRDLETTMRGLKTSIGTALIPVMDRLGKFAVPLFQKFSEAARRWKPLVPIVVGLGMAFAAMLIVSKVVGALKAFSGAMSLLAANPVVLIVLAIAALAVGLVIAYKKVKWFRDAVDAAFGFIRRTVAAVVGWIRENWPLLFRILIGPIGNAVLVIVRNWGKIKAGATAVKNWVVARFREIAAFVTGLPGRIARVGSTAFNTLKSGATAAKNWVRDRVAEIVRFFRDLPGKLGRALGGLGRSISQPFRSAGKSAANVFIRMINWMIRQLNKFHVSVPKWVPGIGGKGFGFNVPQLPELARGGVIVKRGSAIVGDRGPEVLDLPAGAKVTPLAPVRKLAIMPTPDRRGVAPERAPRIITIKSVELKPAEPAGRRGPHDPGGRGSYDLFDALLDGLHLHLELEGHELSQGTARELMRERAMR